MKTIYLSPSKLNLFLESPQCFWDQYAGNVARPRGIFPSLPSGIDRVFKDYTDKFRGSLPPELSGKIPGVLFSDIKKINAWRNWRSGLSYSNAKHSFVLGGALDDLLDCNDYFAPVDCKTKGSEPKDDGSQYYQTQLDCYNLMVRENGMPIKNVGYLVYYWPEMINVDQLSNIDHVTMTFKFKPFKIECNADRAVEICAKAAQCLRGSRPKDPEPLNEYWLYFEGKKKVEAMNAEALS